MSSATLLPPNASKFENSLERSVDKSLDLKVPVRDLWSPENCPVGVLPWLAWALSIDDWDPDWTEAQKRQAVAESVEVHRRKGTVGAVKRAVAVLGYEVEIDEKTGQVYTFNVRLKSNPDQAPSTIEMDEAERLALGAKNVRSHLANIGTLNESNASAKVSAAQLSGETTLIWPEIVDEVEDDPKLLFLSAEQTIETTTVAPFFEDLFESYLNHAVAVVAGYTITLVAEGSAT